MTCSTAKSCSPRLWTDRTTGRARRALRGTSAEALAQFATKQAALQKIVDPYLVGVTLEADDVPVPDMNMTGNCCAGAERAARPRQAG